MRENVNIALVNVEGDLDVLSAPGMRRTVDSLVSRGCRRIVLNMAGASYVDSAGVGVILLELRRMRRLGGLLSLINVSPQVFHALRRMRMVDYMPVSRSGTRRKVSALDPSVLPLWRTTFRADEQSLSGARGHVERLVAPLPLTSDETFDVTLAAGEALGNAFDHAGGGGVLVTVTAYPDRVTIDVADCGCGFSLTDDEEPPETGRCAERGRGIKLMRLLVDSVTIGPKTSGEGTVVRLVKLFGVSAKGDELAPV